MRPVEQIRILSAMSYQQLVTTKDAETAIAGSWGKVGGATTDKAGSSLEIVATLNGLRPTA